MRFAAKFVRLAILSLALLSPFPAAAHNEDDIVRIHQHCRAEVESRCGGHNAKECRSEVFAKCSQGRECWTEKRHRCRRDGTRCWNESVTVCKGHMPCDHRARKTHVSSVVAQLHAQCRTSAAAVCRNDGRRVRRCVNWELGMCLKRNDLCIRDDGKRTRKRTHRQRSQ